MYTDIHSHLVPDVDDGCRTADESLRALEIMKEQNVDTAILTPHMNSDYIEWIGKSSTEDEIRSSFDFLQTVVSMNQDSYPEIYLGSEYYLDCRKQKSGIHPIPMPGGKYVLTELPYESDLDMVIESVDIIHDAGYEVILAHPEKYEAFNGEQKNASLDWLEDNRNILVQNECWDIYKRSEYAWQFVSRGLTTFIATDSHGFRRCPLFSPAARLIGEWAENTRGDPAVAYNIVSGNAENYFML